MFEALNHRLAPLNGLRSPGKQRFLHRIQAFCGISPAFLREFWIVISNLLKSAMIYPSVAIPVHFR
jgi:hypothetical protein